MSSITYVSSKFGHGTDVSTMEDISSSSLISFSVYSKNGYTMVSSSMYMDTTSTKESDSVLETLLFQQYKTYSTQSIMHNILATLDNTYVFMECSEPVTFTGTFTLEDYNNSLSTTSSYYNTTDFGTTFRTH